jgi:hypothetical protein
MGLTVTIHGGTWSVVLKGSQMPHLAGGRAAIHHHTCHGVRAGSNSTELLGLTSQEPSERALGCRKRDEDFTF